MKRPTLALLLAALFVPHALAGCGDDSNGGDDPEADTSESDTSEDAAEADAEEDAEADTGGADTTEDVEEDPEADIEDPEDTGQDVADAEDADDVEEDTTAECTVSFDELVEPPEPDLYTPRWAFLPWISKDISDGPDTYAFVDGFIDRDIPVGVVVLDSPWETQYNTFIPNPERYPDFQDLVDDMRERDVRIVLWTTQMVNEISYDLEVGGDVYTNPAPNFEEGLACDFFVNEGATYNWWKGFGAGVDFFNPEARAWWREQQNMVLDMGVAGWKLDFGDEYITDRPIRTFEGEVSLQEYSEQYYYDFLAYGQDRVGREEFLTMVRPYDESYGFPGRFFARPEHAPVGWVGDNRRDWVGLVDALDHIFRSADAGYVVIGSDIGGYLDRDDENLLDQIPVCDACFYRWTAAGAMMPFMQLHGRANLEPWNYGDDPELTVEIYRYWSQLHTDLIPFWYSTAEAAHSGVADPPIDPIGDGPEAWAGDWRYTVADTFLVAPIFEDVTSRDVLLPEGDVWFDWWNLQAGPLEGGTLLEDVDVSDLGRIPLYVRGGAIVPMEISDEETGLGDASYAGTQTWIYVPSDEASSSFTLYDRDGETTTIEASVDGDSVTVSAGRATLPTIVQIRPSSGFAEVQLAGGALDNVGSAAALADVESGWYHDEERFVTVVKIAASEDPVSLRFVGR